MKLIEKPKDIKNGDYLIIKWSTISEPGYDKGDPNTSRTIQVIYKCDNLAEWLKEIETIEEENRKNKYSWSSTLYCAIKVGSVAEVTLKIDIKE